MMNKNELIESLEQLRTLLLEELEKFKYMHPYELFSKEEFIEGLKDLSLDELKTLRNHFIDMEWYEEIIHIDNAAKNLKT